LRGHLEPDLSKAIEHYTLHSMTLCQVLALTL
jgi:hypothetical protein